MSVVKYDSEHWFMNIMHKEFRKIHPRVQKYSAKEAVLIERVLRGQALRIAPSKITDERIRQVLYKPRKKQEEL